MGRPVYHTVQRGETLSRIGAGYGVPWLKIAEANSIRSPYIIHVGELLLIPVAIPFTSSAYNVIDNGTYSTKRDFIMGPPKRWIVVHDPGVVAPFATIVKAMLTTATTSYNVMFGDTGSGPVARVLVPYSDVAWHSGRASRIPGTNIKNSLVNTYSLGVAHVYPLDERLYSAFVQYLADLIGKLSLPDAGVILGHREVATLRSDPRLPGGRSMDTLRRDVAALLT